jgi:hypothetical protein
MKIVISEQQLRRIISEETSSTIIVSSGFTASNCDELHAFQETKEEVNGKRITKKIGNMNIIVGNKLQELYNKGINPTVKKVTVNVKGMRVDWTCEIGESTDGKAWLGFTSRGSGCGNQSEKVAESASQKKDIRSIKANIESAYGESNIDIEKFAVKTHSDGGNSFVQIFYRYTKPNSFPPIAGGKVTPVNKSNNTPVDKPNNTPVINSKTISIKSVDLSTFLTDIKTETLNKTLDLNSVVIDVDNLSLTVKSSDKGVLVKKLVLTLSTQADGNIAADNVLGKNPGSKVISKGKFENDKRTYYLIALI